jgi:hypothetical protein
MGSGPFIGMNQYHSFYMSIEKKRNPAELPAASARGDEPWSARSFQQRNASERPRAEGRQSEVILATIRALAGLVIAAACVHNLRGA